MAAPDYSLPSLAAGNRDPARSWLLLGVVSLGVSGGFAGLLANTKGAFFYPALVAHVTLSVLVWFLAMASLFFALVAPPPRMVTVAAAIFSSAGTVLMAVSAFLGGEAILNNYIPVLHHPLFFLGLGLLLGGTVLAASGLFTRSAGNDPQRFGIAGAAGILLMAIGCFVASGQAARGLNGVAFYEYAFWGGGHVLQFAYVQLLLVAWVWLAAEARLPHRLLPKILRTLYAFGPLAVLAVPPLYLAWEPLSESHRAAFVLLMRTANGPAAIVLGVALALALARAPKEASARLPRLALGMSILLFAAGGALGYFIDGSTVTVPAHYHGSIVGVTLALMGVCYLLLPRFGYADVSRSTLARIQPVLYGGGQLCWMAGMALLGLRGVPRKTPGSADMTGALAAFLKHGGDGLALVGGLLFVFVVLRAAWKGDVR